MKRSKHAGEPGNCPACITAAETVRNPWQPSYHDVLASGAGDAIKRAHKAAVTIMSARISQARAALAKAKTMQAFVYQAALLCYDCGTHTRRDLDEKLGDAADTGESDDYPQGPYADGGGHADTPQHCDHCETFLANPLTADGVKYVTDTIASDREAGRLASVACTEWAPFYGVEAEGKEG